MTVDCSIEGCGKPASSRGWCQMHYYRWYRHGDPLGFSYLRGRTNEERFWGAVDTGGGEDACWPWTRFVTPDGYGRFQADGRGWRAPRWLWIHRNGPIPDGQVVRHSCDNRRCVNPAHLLLGTAAQNSGDMVKRDRQAKGSHNGYAKLTEPIVEQIKGELAEGQPGVVLAERYGVTPGCISHIATGRSWGHVLVREG